MHISAKSDFKNFGSREHGHAPPPFYKF